MNLDRGAMRLFVNQEAAGRGAQCKRFGKRQRPVAVLAQNPVAARFGAGRGMRINGAAFGDRETFGRQGLDTQVVDAGRDRGLDARFQQLLERSKEQVLQIDAQCQYAVQELRDRRQFFLE